MTTDSKSQWKKSLIQSSPRETFYQLLKRHNRIAEEKIINIPSRDRKQKGGYMWKGDMEVTLVTGAIVGFTFYHFCYDDTGGDWYPSEEKFTNMWSPSLVPLGPEAGSERVDATWHAFYVGDHVYISKLKCFHEKCSGGQIITSIEDGSWKDNPDLWCIV